ncbi:MAG: glycosyltransferase [Verrucomicrobiota bacterium]
MSEPKIIIALSTFNRPVITEICLQSLQAARSPSVRLVVYDDASTAYNKAYLQSKSDEVVRFARNGGIERSRARSMRDFIHRFTDYDLLYLTDNDTVHDPGFVGVLRTLFDLQKKSPTTFPVGLYNSTFHNHPENILNKSDALTVQKTCAGVSQCYTRAMAKTIVNALDHQPELETLYGWDYHWPALLGVPFLQTNTSYLEHFARDRSEGGIHSSNSGTDLTALKDFERDRALNPTEYLQFVRMPIIHEILGLASQSA